MRNFVVLKIGVKYNEHSEGFMFTYSTVKRTGRSRKATGTGSFARIKLCHESLESRRLLTGNNPWEVSLSPGDDISSLSDISISAIGDFSSANSISAVGDFTEPPGSNYFAGNSTEAEQQDVVDSVANGILSRLDALLSNPEPVPPELAPVPPAAMAWVTRAMRERRSSR